MSEIKEIKETIESLRAQKYSSLPKELVDQIIETQYQYGDEKVQASKIIARLIEDYVEQGGN